MYCPYLLISKKRYAGLLYTNPDKHDKMDSKVRNMTFKQPAVQQTDSWDGCTCGQLAWCAGPAGGKGLGSFITLQAGGHCRLCSRRQRRAADFVCKADCAQDCIPDCTRAWHCMQGVLTENLRFPGRVFNAGHRDGAA